MLPSFIYSPQNYSTTNIETKELKETEPEKVIRVQVDVNIPVSRPKFHEYGERAARAPHRVGPYAYGELLCVRNNDTFVSRVIGRAHRLFIEFIRIEI